MEYIVDLVLLFFAYSLLGWCIGLGVKKALHSKPTLTILHSNDTHSQMEPIRTEPDARRGFVIIHRCVKCGEIRRNRAALDAKVQPDNHSLLIRLTAGK